MDGIIYRFFSLMFICFFFLLFISSSFDSFLLCSLTKCGEDQMIRVKGKARKCRHEQGGQLWQTSEGDRKVFTGLVVPLSVGREAEQLVLVAWQRD